MRRLLARLLLRRPRGRWMASLDVPGGRLEAGPLTDEELDRFATLWRERYAQAPLEITPMGDR